MEEQRSKLKIKQTSNLSNLTLIITFLIEYARLETLERRVGEHIVAP